MHHCITMHGTPLTGCASLPCTDHIISPDANEKLSGLCAVVLVMHCCAYVFHSTGVRNMGQAEVITSKLVLQPDVKMLSMHLID